MRTARSVNKGTVDCPLCGELAAVREKSNATLYAYCGDCGMLNVSLAAGQRWLVENAVFWDDEIAPEGTPEWIRLNQAWKHTPEEEAATRASVTKAPVIAEPEPPMEHQPPAAKPEPRVRKPRAKKQPPAAPAADRLIDSIL